MKLKITRLNSLPTPDGDGKYEPNTIYLVKTQGGFVQTIYTTQDGSLAGRSLSSDDLLTISTETLIASQASPLFWFNPETLSLSVKYLTDGAWSWSPLQSSGPGFTVSDMLVVNTAQPTLPSTKVFWFNPSIGGGLHIQVEENGSTIWKQTDFLDESVLQQKVEQAAGFASAADTASLLSLQKATEASASAANAQLEATNAALSKQAASTSASEAAQSKLDADSSSAAALTSKNQAQSSATTALSASAGAVAALNDTNQVKQDVIQLLGTIQQPDLSAMLSKSGNLEGLTDKTVARQNLGLGSLSTKDTLTADDIQLALGYVAADSAVIGDIQTALTAILGPVSTGGGNGGGGEVPA